MLENPKSPPGFASRARCHGTRRNRPARQGHLRFKHAAHRTRKIIRRFGNHNQRFRFGLRVTIVEREVSVTSVMSVTVARGATKTTPRSRARPAPNSQRQPTRRCGRGRDDEDLELRRTRRLSHRPDGDPRPKSTLFQIQDRVANQFRGVIVADQASIDDHVVEQWVVDIGIEILFEVTLRARSWLRQNLCASFLVKPVELMGVLNAFFERSHQPDMKYMGQLGRNHVAAATMRITLPKQCSRPAVSIIIVSEVFKPVARPGPSSPCPIQNTAMQPVSMP